MGLEEVGAPRGSCHRERGRQALPGARECWGVAGALLDVAPWELEGHDEDGGGEGQERHGGRQVLPGGQELD